MNRTALIGTQSIYNHFLSVSLVHATYMFYKSVQFKFKRYMSDTVTDSFKVWSIFAKTFILLKNYFVKTNINTYLLQTTVNQYFKTT